MWELASVTSELYLGIDSGHPTHRPYSFFRAGSGTNDLDIGILEPHATLL